MLIILKIFHKMKKNLIKSFLIFTVIVLEAQAQHIDCPAAETHFQKVIGFYPSISSATINWDLLRQYKSPLECLNLCKEDENCSGFVFHVSEGKCNGFNLWPTNEAVDNRKLIADPAIIFYEKVCLKIPRECQKAWPILRIPASTLIGSGFRHINRLVTRRQCTELCLSEREFICKSATFRLSRRNNYNRGRERDFILTDDEQQEQDYYLSDEPQQQLGECILSRDDKNSKADSFRVANDIGEEYIENQCVPQDFVENQCSYERYLNGSFIYADDVTTGLSEKQCQERCDSESRFKCIGVTFNSGKVPPSRNTKTTCTLHSDDIISLGPRSIRPTIGSVYMRRVRCLNVNVICDGETMIVRYLPEQYFVGKLYVAAASRKNCSMQSQSDLGLLRIPLGNETRENSCGIVRAYQLANATTTTTTGLLHNRTLISTTIVIQNHPSVQSQGDRLVKVGCILNGSGKSIGGADRQSKLLDVVESEIQVAGLQVPNIQTGRHPLRPVVQLVDMDNNIESKIVEVGQNLQLRVFYPDANGYDLSVVNLKASSATGQDIYLLDFKGCPIDETIFPEMMFTNVDGALTLVGQFIAFKFADSPYVDLSMTVRSCYKMCPEHNCERVMRAKRQTQINPIVFPSATPSTTLGPVLMPMPITFPKYMTNKQVVDEDGESNEAESLKESLHNSIENVVYQRVISSFDEPFDEKVRKLSDNNGGVVIEEVFKNFSKMVEFPVTLRLNVFSSSDNISPESLIYGENSYSPSLTSDGAIIETAEDTICVDQTFILCLLLFFAILVIVLVIGCALMLFRYKRKLQQEEDRNSLHRYHFGFEPYDIDSLSRRVHWADGFANARSAYP